MIVMEGTKKNGMKIIEDIETNGFYILCENDYDNLLGYEKESTSKKLTRLQLSLLAYEGDEGSIIFNRDEFLLSVAKELKCTPEELYEFLTAEAFNKYLYDTEQVRDELLWTGCWETRNR